MFTLKTEKRNLGIKPKKLRRDGLIPGAVYGKDVDGSINIQIPERAVVDLLKENSTGSKVEVVVDGKKYTTLLREVDYVSTTNDVEHLSFQTLQADEVVESLVRIVLLNREKVFGTIQHPQSEVSYKALPVYLIDKIEIDLEGLKVGDSIRVSDLDIAKDPNVEILTPLDTMIVSVVESRTLDVDDENESDADVNPSELEVVSKSEAE